MNKELDDVALQVMLNNTQYKKQPEQTTEHWFSFNNQKQLTFHLAANIYAISECDPKDAISDATDFVNQFYQSVMNPKSFK